MSGIAYNPGLQRPEELVASFVARGPLLALIVEDLESTQPQHHLFIGQRGMGKTTLLRRVAAEVARDPNLSERWIALTFPEEQYNVARLSDLWLNCLDALADALETEGATAEVLEIEEFVSSLAGDEASRADRALQRLLRWAESGRSMVLCVDNLQQVFGRLTKDERWALRKVLGEEHRLVVLAASPAAPAETTDYGEPFYDFFQAHSLRGLTLDETLQVLQSLANQAGKPELAASFGQKGGRLKALHILTGGNPRTVVQLFDVVAAAPGAEIKAQLQGLLDQCTPLYKARFEELPEQAQLVVDALAHHWDPATAAMIAERTRIEVNTVSTQLHRLHLEGLIDKVDIPGEARQGFQVSERFFNLWYLMRASRRHRGRVLSLARCLETLYEIDDLQALGAQLLANAGEADFSMAVAGALPEGGMRRALWSRAIDQVAHQERELQALIAQMGPSAGPAKDLAERKRRAKEAMEVAKGIDFEGMGVERELGEVACCQVALPGVDLAAVAVDPQFVGMLPEVNTTLGHWRALLGGPVWRAVRDATREGVLANVMISEQDSSDLQSAALLFKSPQLALRVRIGQMPPVEWSTLARALLAKPDAELDRLTRSLGIESPPGSTSAQLTGWEEVARGLMDRPDDTRFDDLAVIAATRALALGTLDTRVLLLTTVVAGDGARTDQAVARLLSDANPASAWLGPCTFWPITHAHPSQALRLYHHFASLSDPLEDTQSLLAFLAALIRADHTEEAFQIAVGLRDRAEPLHAAMFAVRGDDVALLGRFAPEIAAPARDMLQVLWPEGLARAPTPRNRKNRRK